ncbi:tumor protein D52 isoform X1 [Anabrus simplex]|uniref:tumor protein D52 isoform X1 n=1 Tax=Anabrus simplex TaxID=316456 RepID=UPI0034DDA3B8
MLTSSTMEDTKASNNNEDDIKPDSKLTQIPDVRDDGTDGPESLEYEEDCYYSYIVDSEAMGLDNNWADEIYYSIDSETGGSLPLGLVDTLSVVDDSCSVETEFYSKSPNKKTKSVRVTFQDISKPYLARVTSPRNYRRFLQLVKAEEAPVDMSPDSGINELQGLTPEEQERQRQEWQQELAKVEEEIQTLRHVLASKVRNAQELKRKLGISVWKEFQDDMSQGIRNVKESNVYHNVEEKIGQIGKAVAEAPLYQKTESVIKTTAEKTTTLLGGLGSSVSTKLGQLKNSDSFRSFEERVGSAYENVKTKVVTSRSNSTQSFDEALREAEGNRKASGAASPATSPTIPEDRPLS